MSNTVIESIEVTPTGVVMVRFAKDGVIGRLHRTSFEPGCDVDAHMRIVNAHLLEMGSAQVSDYSEVKSRALKVWTSEIVELFGARRKQS